jgi:hypothetical protein
MQWVQQPFSPGVKRPRREADHSTRTRAEVKTTWISTSTVPCLHSVVPNYITKTKRTSWPESTSELYRPSDCLLSAKSVPSFADRGCTHEAEWTTFQTHHFSENLMAPGIEHEPLDHRGGIIPCCIPNVN